MVPAIYKSHPALWDRDRDVAKTQEVLGRYIAYDQCSPLVGWLSMDLQFARLIVVHPAVGETFRQWVFPTQSRYFYFPEIIQGALRHLLLEVRRQANA
jgi:hypothetical protein